MLRLDWGMHKRNAEGWHCSAKAGVGAIDCYDWWWHFAEAKAAAVLILLWIDIYILCPNCNFCVVHIAIRRWHIGMHFLCLSSLTPSMAWSGLLLSFMLLLRWYCWRCWVKAVLHGVKAQMHFFLLGGLFVKWLPCDIASSLDFSRSTLLKRRLLWL